MDDMTMKVNREFELFVDELLSGTVEEFKSTEEYVLMKEKLDRMDCKCDTMFRQDEKDFAIECFELLLEVDFKEEYVYRKGLRDFVFKHKESVSVGMNYTSEVLDRVKIQHIREFLLHGMPCWEISDKSYEDRIDELQKARLVVCNVGFQILKKENYGEPDF